LTQHKIELDTSIPPTHQVRYKLNLDYATIIKQDIDKLLTTRFIQLVKEATWLSPILVILKNNGKLIICVDFRKLNKVTKKILIFCYFFCEILNTITWYEAYSFLDGYLGYHQIFIAIKDRYKTTFVIDHRAFVWMVMPFGVKNGPPTFQRVVSRTFRKYLDQFMKIFLDDFIVYIDMENHLMKLKLCFQKCKDYRINFNPKKCAFLWYF